MAPHLLLALLGLLYVLFFGILSFFRREGLSMRFTAEAVSLTAIAVAAALAGWALHPVVFLFLLYLITMRVRLLVDFGNTLARRRNHGAAERVYAIAERLWPDESSRLLVQLNQGVLALHRGRPEESVTALRGVLAAAGRGYLGVKSQSACYYNLGVAHQRLGQDAQATLAFNAVLDTWPASEYARYARIALEKRKKKSETEKT